MNEHGSSPIREKSESSFFVSFVLCVVVICGMSVALVTVFFRRLREG